MDEIGKFKVNELLKRFEGSFGDRWRCSNEVKEQLTKLDKDVEVKVIGTCDTRGYLLRYYVERIIEMS